MKHPLLDPWPEKPRPFLSLSRPWMVFFLGLALGAALNRFFINKLIAHVEHAKEISHD